MLPTTTPAGTDADAFDFDDFNAARPFSSFLPGIAGEYGKPMWAFYANRGQCIASFGVRDRNGAMLEFQPANKAYALTPLFGFRSFFRFSGPAGITLHEPFLAAYAAGVSQRLRVHADSLEIEESHPGLGLRMRIVYFTLPGEHLPALVRQVTVENIGAGVLCADVLDGLPQIVPYGLEEKLLKQMSRTMEAFAEVRHADQALPFYKLKVEPSDKPEVQWIEAGFFAFTVHDGAVVPVVADPELVFGSDTSLRTPLNFLRAAPLDTAAGRRETLTGCAFASLRIDLAPGASTRWTSCFGQSPDWDTARRFRQQVVGETHYGDRKRAENRELVSAIGARLALIAGPAQLDAYSRQAFLDNTLRGGQPVAIDGPRGRRVFHAFTRKHGDMERDYNVFELAPSYWSQGSANFRDVNQNRRSENFTYPAVGTANIETFFNLIQLDGNNPLVVHPERFRLPPAQLPALWQAWPAGDTPGWREFLGQPFTPGLLLEALLADGATPQQARPRFECILGHADKVEGAAHGEGYWVDHWIYNLDLIDSYAALYPDRLRALLVERADFGYFDNDHVVQPRDRKVVLRADGSVRQLHAVVRDAEKSALIAQRTDDAHAMRTAHGHGGVYRTTLMAKLLNLFAIKACLLDPAGVGLEMDAEKPGWCDALNGLPGLFGSSTHEAFALRRGLAFLRRAVHEHLGPAGALAVAVEVAALVRSVGALLVAADPSDFFPTWQALAARREAFRAETRFGIAGDEVLLGSAEILQFVEAADAVLARGLARAVDADGLPVSYYTHAVTDFELIDAAGRDPDDAPAPPSRPGDPPAPVRVRVRGFAQRPVGAFLEGAVHALRSCADPAAAQALHDAVRRSALHDEKLGMYRVNAPLDAESFEIGRSRIFTPGWLENESIFLHMHYKFLLETLRSGLPQAFYADLRRGLVAFHDPAVYGRSPLENSSFIASSRFPDARVHGTGFVARLSGATAEWISMVLHMGLGATPFRMVDGELRFAPEPVLADWLFTDRPTGGFDAGCFGLTLFGRTWVVYDNPAGRATFGPAAVAPAAFDLAYTDGRHATHAGAWLPAPLAHDLRDGRLDSVRIRLA